MTMIEALIPNQREQPLSSASSSFRKWCVPTL